MTGRASLVEVSVERDRDLLSGTDLARVKYRSGGQRRWSKFVVFLDNGTTFEDVEANAESLIALYEARQ